MMRHLPAAAVLCTLAAGCAQPIAKGDDGGFFEIYRDVSVPMSTVQDFSPERYLGTWFEYARFPVFFERGCANVTATYGPVDQDTISVLNICRDLAGAATSTIMGTADIVGDGKLAVRFPSVPFGAADYWVLWVDPDYQIAVVGAPNGRSGWILSRSKSPAAGQLATARQVLRDNGYNLDRMLTVPQGEPQ